MFSYRCLKENDDSIKIKMNGVRNGVHGIRFCLNTTELDKEYCFSYDKSFVLYATSEECVMAALNEFLDKRMDEINSLLESPVDGKCLNQLVEGDYIYICFLYNLDIDYKYTTDILTKYKILETKNSNNLIGGLSFKIEYNGNPRIFFVEKPKLDLSNYWAYNQYGFRPEGMIEPDYEGHKVEELYVVGTSMKEVAWVSYDKLRDMKNKVDKLVREYNW